MGAIWRIDRNGVATKWLESPVLGGTGPALAAPVGANGIVYRKGVLTVANAERFGLFTVPILGDGSRGAISPGRRSGGPWRTVPSV